MPEVQVQGPRRGAGVQAVGQEAPQGEEGEAMTQDHPDYLLLREAILWALFIATMVLNAVWFMR